MIYSNGGWSGENIGMFRPQHPNFNFHCHCTVGVLRYLGMLTDVMLGLVGGARVTARPGVRVYDGPVDNFIF